MTFYSEKSKEKNILEALNAYYPSIKIALNFSNVWELLVATILSAQCTDERVNIITKDLFVKYTTIPEYANAPLEEITYSIRSAGLFRSKAGYIKKSAQKILKNYSGHVPKTMSELLSLPGVARKTANVVLYNGYGKNEGIAVDTHVKRISNLLGLTESENPQKVEKDLLSLYPREEWGNLNHRLVQYGRDICIARRPKCEICVLKKECAHYQKTLQK
ncbi:endonuclease III [PVC group bacterium (ex Bugula neritina AB1)]|nr:endonuclease III [PVC group bacterium (ex Bugula neritina AB1)]